jgi:thiol:disulfide interchange protein DsbD
MSVYDGETVIRFRVTIDSTAADGEYLLPVSFTGQPCNDRECRAPQTIETDLKIAVGPEGSPINAELFAVSVEETTPPAEATPVTDENDLERLIREYGFWGYFLALGLAFITGLLLSFSPCTYPMIPITVSIFAGQERSVGRGFVLSLFYVGTMALMYGIMGLIVSLVGGVFGAWLASTPVVIGISVVFVIFSLSMFGLYELQVPTALRNKLGTTGGGGGIGGAMVLGIIAALVVSPCVGPFVAGILLYVATSGSPVIGFLMLFVFALGLGTLYVIIGTSSSAINALPNSGAWMETVKKFFGFVLLLMALYFLRTVISAELTAILTALVLLALGVFGGGLDRLTPDTTFFLRLKKFIGVLALLIGGYLLIGSLVTQGFILPASSGWLPGVPGAAADEEVELIPWERDLEAGLARAKAEQKPVLIDTWATWCVNCRVLDEKTFGHPMVAAEAGRFVPIKVQLETDKSAITRDFMARFGLKHYSLPTTLLLDSQGQVRRIMQGVIEPEDMIAEMEKIR